MNVDELKNEEVSDESRESEDSGEQSDESVVLLHWFEEITLTKYTASHNSQNLPAKFAAPFIDCDMDYVFLRNKDGRKFRRGLYVNKKRLAKGFYETRISSGWKKC